MLMYNIILFKIAVEKVAFPLEGIYKNLLLILKYYI